MVYILGIMVDSNVSREAQWLARNEPVDLDGREALFIALIDELAALRPLTSRGYSATVRALSLIHI